MAMTIDGSNGLTFNNATVQNSAGQVLQVVNATYSTIASTSSSPFIATGLTASITPLFSTSKILVFVSQTGIVSAANSSGVGLRLMRNSTQIDYFIVLASYVSGVAVTGVISTSSTTYLDSPATTSSVTYSTQFSSNNNTNLVSVQNNGDTSTITLMEIAG
jgi:hypothetical protein